MSFDVMLLSEGFTRLCTVCGVAGLHYVLQRRVVSLLQVWGCGSCCCSLTDTGPELTVVQCNSDRNFSGLRILNLVMDIALQTYLSPSSAFGGVVVCVGSWRLCCSDAICHKPSGYLQMVGVGAHTSDGRLLGSLEPWRWIFLPSCLQPHPGPCLTRGMLLNKLGGSSFCRGRVCVSTGSCSKKAGCVIFS